MSAIWRLVLAAFFAFSRAKHFFNGLLSNSLIDAGEDIGSRMGEIDSNERFGGMLKYYHRRAA